MYRFDELFYKTNVTLRDVIEALKDDDWKVRTYQVGKEKIRKILTMKGWRDGYSWSDGTRAEGVKIYVLTKQGKLYEVPYDDSGSTGSGDQWDNEGMTVAEYLKERSIQLEAIKAFIVKDFSYCTWEYQADEHYNANIYIPKESLDIAKIRRRIEDVLRKSSGEKIIATAVFLGVKLD